MTTAELKEQVHPEARFWAQVKKRHTSINEVMNFMAISFSTERKSEAMKRRAKR